MPEEQERRSPKRPTARTPKPDEPGTPSPPEGPARAAGEPVDFKAAAQRLSARAALIARLKSDVQDGSYESSPDETARAMERRSDS